jgi:hypothetical protein
MEFEIISFCTPDVGLKCRVVEATLWLSGLNETGKCSPC